MPRQSLITVNEMLKTLSDPNGITEDVWLSIINVVGTSPMAQRANINNVSCFGGRYYVTELQRRTLRNLIPFMSGIPPVENIEQLALPAYTGSVSCGRCKLPAGNSKHEFSYTDISCGACFKEFQYREMDTEFKRWKEIRSLTSAYKWWRTTLNEDVSLEKQKFAKCSRCTGPFHEATGTVINPKYNIFLCGPCSGVFYAHQLHLSGWRTLTPKQLKKLNQKKAKEAKQEVKAAKELAKRLAKEEAEKERLYGRPREAQSAPSVELH